MINVTDTDKTNSVISYLRSNIYNNDSFKEDFSLELSKLIPLEKANFVPEQYGGWSVYLDLNNNGTFFNYSFMIINIIRALNNIIINDLKDTVISDTDITNNIFSIISSGPSSYVIKL